MAPTSASAWKTRSRPPSRAAGAWSSSAPIARLSSPATALDTHDAAFAPAEDGGYVLIALAKALPVFAEMPWSTPQVMSRTRERLRSAGARWTELRTLWDVDRPEDLARLQQAGLVPGLA
jgi:glycosyltransferase A (GT-A) superfamily protein (DUF2064 family)